MARPKAELPPAAAILALLDTEGRLALRVTPGARSEGITVVEGKVHVKVRARPTDGEANEAVIALLAKAVKLGETRVELLRGSTGRDKVVRILL